MKEEEERLALVILRCMDAKLDGMIERLDLFLKPPCLSDLVSTPTQAASARLDRLEHRLERIERRLDLVEDHA